MLAQLVIKLKRAESSRAEPATSRASSRATSILSSPNSASSQSTSPCRSTSSSQSPPLHSTMDAEKYTQIVWSNPSSDDCFNHQSNIKGKDEANKIAVSHCLLPYAASSPPSPWPTQTPRTFLAIWACFTSTVTIFSPTTSESCSLLFDILFELALHDEQTTRSINTKNTHIYKKLLFMVINGATH
jgi:hypothetical protein